MNRGPMGVKPQVENPMKIFKRLMEYVFRYYKFHYLAVIALRPCQCTGDAVYEKSD